MGSTSRVEGAVPGQAGGLIMWNENLVVRMGGLGDLSILSSSLVALKTREPWRPLVLATLPHNIPLLQGAFYLDRVIDVEDMDKEKWFKVYDLRWSVEAEGIGAGKATWEDYTTQDRSDLFDRRLGVKGTKWFSLPVDKKALEEVKSLLPKGKVIGIAPTSKSPVRCMPLEYVRPLIKLLTIKFDCQIVLFGKTESWSSGLSGLYEINTINLMNLLSVKELVALVSLLDAIISPDTATYHIAAAMHRKCLALFGNIEPHTRTTYYPTVMPMHPAGELHCIPCWDVPHSCARVPGQFGGSCMRLLTPERIVEGFEYLVGDEFEALLQANNPIMRHLCPSAFPCEDTPELSELQLCTGATR